MSKVTYYQLCTKSVIFKSDTILKKNMVHDFITFIPTND